MSRETEYNGKFYLPYLDAELKCLSLISAKIPESSKWGRPSIFPSILRVIQLQITTLH